MLDVIEFIIIDDRSPLHYEIPNFNINLRWIKINENIKWNQAGARNLGVLSAKSDKFIITDLDHVFYEDTLKFMVDSDFKWVKFINSGARTFTKMALSQAITHPTEMYLR